MQLTVSDMLSGSMLLRCQINTRRNSQLSYEAVTQCVYSNVWILLRATL